MKLAAAGQLLHGRREIQFNCCLLLLLLHPLNRHVALESFILHSVGTSRTSPSSSSFFLPILASFTQISFSYSSIYLHSAEAQLSAGRASIRLPQATGPGGTCFQRGMGARGARADATSCAAYIKLISPRWSQRKANTFNLWLAAQVSFRFVAPLTKDTPRLGSRVG